jgi:hypothetical protein
LVLVLVLVYIGIGIGIGSRIISKLPLYGIRDKELAWLESYLFDRKQFVQYDGHRSETQHIPCGVPQGSILGPLLFISSKQNLWKSK